MLCAIDSQLAPQNRKAATRGEGSVVYFSAIETQEKQLYHFRNGNISGLTGNFLNSIGMKTRPRGFCSLAALAPIGLQIREKSAWVAAPIYVIIKKQNHGCPYCQLPRYSCNHFGSCKFFGLVRTMVLHPQPLQSELLCVCSLHSGECMSWSSG